MSKKSNPTLIGAFVIGAVSLFALGVALFGGAELFAERHRFVAYFVENTGGLRVGSNVVVNGVRIGHVSGIALLVDSESFETKTEVTIEILTDSYIATRGGIRTGRRLDATTSLGRAIDEAGLRATLDVESFVTGQLLVELQFRPDVEAIRRGGLDAPHPEIPTIPSRSQEVLGKVQRAIGKLGDAFDIESIGQHLDQALAGLDELANSEELRESLAGINAIINKDETQELTATLEDTLKNLSDAASEAAIVLRRGDGTLESLQPAIDNLATALDEAQATLSAARSALEGQSTQGYQLGQTLREVEAAARSLREFLDLLEQHPESFLRGKQQ